MHVIAIEAFEIALLGMSAGLIGGLAGIGGSLIMIPGLIFLLGYDDDAHTQQHVFMAAAMVVNFLVAAPSALRHHKSKVVRLDVARYLIPTMMCAILVGVLLSDRIEGSHLKNALAVFMMIYSITNLWRAWQRYQQRKHNPEASAQEEQSQQMQHRIAVAPIIGIGALTGLIAGLLGIGGGLIMVPLLLIALRLPLRQAIGTSSAVMCLTALVGSALKLWNLAPEHGREASEALTYAILMGPTASVGAWFGAHLMHKLPLQTVRVIISVLLIVGALKMLGVF